MDFGLMAEVDRRVGQASESGKGADMGEVADAGQRASAVEQAPVGGDVRAVEFHCQREERGIVEGETELAAQAARTLQERGGGRGDDERESFETIEGIVEARGAQPGLEQQDVPDLVQEERRDVNLQRSDLHLLQQGPRLCQEILVTRLEPLDED